MINTRGVFEVGIEISASIAVRLHLYPLKNFANANLLLHFSSVEICVSVLRLIQRNFGGGGIQMLSGE